MLKSNERESAVIKIIGANKDFCVRSVSAVLWMMFVLAAVALAADAEYRYGDSVVGKMLVALPRAIGFYMFLFSYQLVLAILIGNALMSESSPAHRIGLGVIYFFTFAVMLLNVLVIRVPVLAFPMLIATPLTCLFCGIYLIARQHYLSGAVASGLSLLTWLPPIMVDLLSHLYC